MILDTTNQYVSSYDDFSIVPWEFEENFIKPWDKMAEVCRFRKFVDSKSRSASRKRLSTIIYANAQYLKGSKRTDKDTLTVRFLDRWILACQYLENNHQDDAEGLEIMGARYTITMGPWQFLQPDISNIVHLAGLYCGEEDALSNLEVDKRRRQDKAKALRQLAAHWSEAERKIAYLLKDAEQIKMVEPALIKALAQVEDEVEFLANETQV